MDTMNMNRKKARRLLWKQSMALVMMCCLLLSSIPAKSNAASIEVNAVDNEAAESAVSRASVTDIAGHWGEKAITKWLEQGLLAGYPDGTFQPDNAIIRSELITLVNKSFGFMDKSAVTFSDVPAASWFYEEVAKAQHAGYITGYEDETFRPDRALSREEMAVMIAGMLSLQKTDGADKFSDAKNRPEWSKGSLGAVIDKGIMDGYEDGTFRPTGNITRAEAIAVLDRALALRETVYDKAGTYGPESGTPLVLTNVIVNAPGVTLQNMEIKGKLLLAEGIGEGDVILKNVKVTGTTTVKGGGPNSIHFENTILSIVVIDKADGAVRVVFEGSSTAEELLVNSPATVEAGVSNAAVNSIAIVKLAKELEAGAKVVLKGSFGTVQVEASGVNIEMKDGTIKQFNLAEGAAGTTLTLGKDAAIISLILDAVIKVLGDGKIEKASYGEKAKGSTFEHKPDKEEGAGAPSTTSPGSSSGSLTPSPTASPSPSVSPSPSPAAAYITKNGIANADILISPDASEMESFAAEELQSTVKMVSGAELPILKGEVDGISVSAQLWSNKLDIKKSGIYPIQIQLINNGSNGVRVQLIQTDSGPIASTFLNEVELGAKESKSVNGTVEVLNTIMDGIYTVSIQASADDIPPSTMTLTVNLDRNLISNPGFEKKAAGSNLPEGWNVPSGALDNQESHSGENSLRIDLGQWEYIYATTDQQLKLEPGREYVLEAWVKGSAAQGQKIIAQFMEMKNNGEYTPGTSQASLNVTNDWTRVQLKYTPQAETQLDFAWIYFYIVAGTDKLWIDDVTLREVGDSPAPEPEPVKNLISNPGFEKKAAGSNLPEGWNVPSGELDNQESHSGANSLRIDLGQWEYIYATTDQQLKLEPGREYVLEAWVKGSAAQGQKVIGQFMEMKNNGEYVPGTPQALLDVTDDWTHIELKYTPQAETQLDYVWIYFYIIAGTDKLWIDDVSLMLTDSGQQDNETSLDVEQPQMALHKVSKLPEVHTLGADSGTSEERLQIILGTTESYPVSANLFPDDIAYLQHSDGYAIRKSGNRIYILGTEPKGVLNGVYDFLEKNAGVLWTRSTDIGTLYDPLTTIEATKVDYVEKSPFKVRGWNLTGYGANGEYHEDPGTEAMMARNKMNAKMAEFANLPLWERHEAVGVKSFTLGHNLGYWLPNELYFDSHKDYYNKDSNGNYIPVADDTQINFYHPDVPGVIAGRVKQFLVEHPIEYVGIGINDNHYFNQGELSSSPFTTEDGTVIQPDEADYKSTVFYSFLNKIAAEVKATYPNVKIVTFAYFFTDIPPRVKLEDNIVIVMAPLTGDDRVPFNTSDESSMNYSHRLKLEGWLEKTTNVVMYNYYGSFLSDTYERPIADKVQADMKYYRDLGITGVIPEGLIDARVPNWSINALQFWLFQKLYWNPDADIEQLKQEYIQKAYGAAAEPMRRYYDLIEQGWNYDQQPIAYNTSANTYIGTYVIKAGIKDAAQAALNEAWSLADAKEKLRIEPIKATFEAMVLKIGELPNLSAKATKTTASKEEIINGLDFSQGPWADAEPVTEFFHLGTTNRAPVETKVRLLWDEENLYVGYENFDDDVSKIVASDTVTSAHWWSSGADDDVETYITGDLTGSSYYAFFVNPKAVQIEYSGPNANGAFTTEWEAHAKVGTDRWNAIKVIPFASINVDPSVSKTLKAFFFREYHGMEGFFGWGGGSVWSWSDFKTVTLEE
ncbi:DUF4838 domain-containing protein [Paenibacillus eucommiae]|uniref:SLH domain-containing protein n=1 Tax=Paenibacillus eucommiae TaxID=1355755 RepID=A0ABS4IQ32_9BACL|nr:DUF4838 domain-containing protein [Paenibacillus eucommiae]MBP1988724.1 hypothetical protein [Paenibacillus eucommiae]